MSEETQIIPAEVVVDKSMAGGALYDDDLAIRRRLKNLVDTEPLENLSGMIQTEVNNRTQVVDFRYSFVCFREDGALSINKAVKEIQNYTSYGSKGPSSKPPTTLDVAFADGTHIKVPWGQINLPNMGENAHIELGYDVDTRTMHVRGECERRYTKIMDRIVEQAKKYIAEESIYRGTAFTLGSNLLPRFIDLSTIEQQTMVLTNGAQFALEPILARIERPEVCRDQNLPLKFGALLEGEYGTGKTLLAFKLAKKAIDNDWAFVYLTDPKKTAEAMTIVAELSSNGNGVLFFVEDIDLILSSGRGTEMNKIFNILDGGDTKDKAVISVFTTNHLEKINPTFLRGKRIGALITLSHLDQPTAVRFVDERFPEGITEDGLTVDEVGQKVEDLKIVPAFFAEILDRVQANLIYKGKDEVTTTDIDASIDSYKTQMDLATTKNQKQQTNADILAESLSKVLDDTLEPVKETLKTIEDNV